MNTIQERFGSTLSQRVQDFENEQQDEKRREKAIKLINVFRALFTGPLTPGFHPIQTRHEYQSVVTKIAALDLPWSDLDSSTVPPEHSADVRELQAVLFEPEREKLRALPKSGGLFGRLDVDSLQKDYLAGDV